MKTPFFLMDILNTDFYCSMVDYVYDDTNFDLPEGMIMMMMGCEL